MLVLRRRRGFTTNSSSAAEWATATPGAGGPKASGTPLPNGTEIILLPQGVTPVPSPGPAATGVSLSPGVGNALLLGGIAAVVGVSFVLERWLRRRRKRDE